MPIPELVSLLALSAAASSRVQADSSLEVNAPFESSIPRPESMLNYRIGSRITTYRDQERVLDSMMVKSAGRVRRIDYGESNQRFPLRVYAISSARNIARFDQIREALEQNARKGTPLPKDTPAIVWVNEAIHGNEPASFESAMALMYNLVAGRGPLAGALEKVIVVLNPVYNPDGHERFAVSYNSVARGEAAESAYEKFEVDALWGRFNHYRFDMNRDRVSFSQVETRSEVKLMQSIRPQIYLDQHGQVENYFFPPNPMAINANLDRTRLNKWTEILGKACASSFDKRGWSYYVREDFDIYYPGYLDSHTTLSGAIGITHETDGGKELAKLRSDGSVVTLREGAAKHLVAALACIQAAADNRDALLSDWSAYKARGRSGAHAGAFKRVIVRSSNVLELEALQAKLALTGVVSAFTTGSQSYEARSLLTDKTETVTFPAGSLVIDMAQEYGQLAKALLERQSDFEPEFIESQLGKRGTAPEGESYPGPDDTEFYDITGWGLTFAHNLDAYALDAAPPISTSATAQTGKFSALNRDTPLGYYLRYDGEEDILAVARLLASGHRVSMATTEMKVGGQTLPKGTFVVFKARNQALLIEDLARIHSVGTAFEVLPTSYPDAARREGPGNRLVALKAPKLGIVFGNGPSLASVSGIWWTMEEAFRLPFSALSSASLSAKLLSDFTAIVLPQGSNAASNSALKEWVRQGGVVISLGDDAVVTGGMLTLEPKRSSTRSIPGSIFLADLDQRLLLTSGYAAGSIPVPVSGSSFFGVKTEGGGVVKFPGRGPKRLLTGWSWGEESENALADSVWMHDEPVGRGHVIWFAQDPTERAMWPGLHKLLLNSMIIAPGN